MSADINEFWRQLVGEGCEVEVGAAYLPQIDAQWQRHYEKGFRSDAAEDAPGGYELRECRATRTILCRRAGKDCRREVDELVYESVPELTPG